LKQLPLGSDVQRTPYDELTDFYALGQKALIFQQQATGVEPVTSEPWVYAQQVSLNHGQEFYTQLTDDWNYSEPSSFSARVIYFGYIQVTILAATATTNANSYRCWLLTYAFQGIAASLFLPSLQSVSPLVPASSTGQYFYLETSVPVFFNYAYCGLIDPSGSGNFNFRFYGRRISI